MTTIREIQQTVCAEFGISQADMLGRSRKASIVAARHHAMRLARATGASLPKIGRSFNRDHSTVHAALRKAMHGPA